MTIRKAQNAIAKVEARLQLPFTAQKEKTPLFNTLDGLAMAVHQAVGNAVEGRANEFDVILHIPMSFGQILANKKSTDMNFITKAISDYAPEYADFFSKGLELYLAVKAASLPLTKRDKEEALQKEQANIVKAQEKHGLRFENIFANGVDCRNENGTSWTRYDWYVKYSRTSYQDVVIRVTALFKFWLSNGRPNMENWDTLQILDFYQTV